MFNGAQSNVTLTNDAELMTEWCKTRFGLQCEARALRRLSGRKSEEALGGARARTTRTPLTREDSRQIRAQFLEFLA